MQRTLLKENVMLSLFHVWRQKFFFLAGKNNFRSRQDSNLRGETPLDFKSNALTTRPRLLFLL
jgi:hypothetical protein